MWVQCDACQRWRELSQAEAAELTEGDSWTCACNADVRYNRCEVPEDPRAWDGDGGDELSGEEEVGMVSHIEAPLVFPPPREADESAHPTDPGEEIRCVCGVGYNGEFMLDCDQCHCWFHGSCVGVADAEEELPDEWLCDACRLSNADEQEASVEVVVLDALHVAVEGELIEGEEVVMLEDENVMELDASHVAAESEPGEDIQDELPAPLAALAVATPDDEAKALVPRQPLQPLTSSGGVAAAAVVQRL